MNETEVVEYSASTEREMHAAQDVAAREFWAYPPPNWQLNFQADWLRKRGFVAEADKREKEERSLGGHET